MKKYSPLQVFVDPASGSPSASRVCSIIMCLTDVSWMICCVLGIPPKDAYAPVSSMLGIVSGACFAAYGVNSMAGPIMGGINNIITNIRGTAPKSQDVPPPARPPGS